MSAAMPAVMRTAAQRGEDEQVEGALKSVGFAREQHYLEL
jgi:hypothetical protein